MRDTRDIVEKLREGSQWIATNEKMQEGADVIERHRAAAKELLRACDDSDEGMYGTLTTAFVRSVLKDIT